MARRIKRRGSKRLSKDRLKGKVYQATVPYVTTVVTQGEPGDPRARRLWEDACDAALRGGVTHAEMETIIRKASRDAEAIQDFLDQFPESLVKVTETGWEVEGEYDA